MQRFLNGAATGLAVVAGLFVAAMMLLTVVDVVLRDVFNTGIQGTLEIIELLMACAFFIALPALFIRDAHIVVDVVDSVKPRWVPRLKRLAVLAAAITLAAMTWQGWIAAQDTLMFGDVTSDLSMPRIWYWIPVLFGMAASAVAAAVIFLMPSSTAAGDAS